MHLGGEDLLSVDTKYNDEIKVPVEKWLYSYSEVGLFDSFDGIPIADDE